MDLLALKCEYCGCETSQEICTDCKLMLAAHFVNMAVNAPQKDWLCMSGWPTKQDALADFIESCALLALLGPDGYKHYIRKKD